MTNVDVISTFFESVKQNTFFIILNAWTFCLIAAEKHHRKISIASSSINSMSNNILQNHCSENIWTILSNLFKLCGRAAHYLLLTHISHSPRYHFSCPPTPLIDIHALGGLHCPPWRPSSIVTFLANLAIIQAPSFYQQISEILSLKELEVETEAVQGKEEKKCVLLTFFPFLTT